MRIPGLVSVNNYPYNIWFEETGDERGSGWKLNETMIETLKASRELVPGYYNDCVLHGNSMLVTDDIANIKNPS